MTRLAELRPIDPLQVSHGGRYEDDAVVVTYGRSAPRGAVRTGHFATWNRAGKVHVRHALAPNHIDNDLAGLLADELFSPGWLRGSDSFERVFTGIVLTSASNPDVAWELFYRNTLAALAGRAEHPIGSLGMYAPVYAHAASLVAAGSVLELGCCFGFLSLQLAAKHRVTASDISTSTLRLLDRIAPRLGLGVATIACDAARVPAPAGAFDTVLAIHLLEHLEAAHGQAVLTEALRLARRRVIVAVPFEDEPATVYGHVRTFDLDDLVALGRRSGWRATAYSHHGGWLVLDA